MHPIEHVHKMIIAGNVLGPDFEIIDTYPVRVRLPDEPLMLVDRIISVHGEKLSLTSGKVVTQHDVHENAWYLDGGRAPVCISVEAGQADLFALGQSLGNLDLYGFGLATLVDGDGFSHSANLAGQ